MVSLAPVAIRPPSSQAQIPTRIESVMGIVSFESVIFSILVAILLFRGLAPTLIRLGLRIYYRRHKPRTSIYVPYLAQINSPDPPRLTAMELENALRKQEPVAYTVNKKRSRKNRPDLEGE